jgi:hypothetical protein
MLYDPEKSSTAENQNKTFEIAYGTGESHGDYYADMFAVSMPSIFIIPPLSSEIQQDLK